MTITPSDLDYPVLVFLHYTEDGEYTHVVKVFNEQELLLMQSQTDFYQHIFSNKFGVLDLIDNLVPLKIQSITDFIQNEMT